MCALAAGGGRADLGGGCGRGVIRGGGVFLDLLRFRMFADLDMWAFETGTKCRFQNASHGLKA
jgi:hypothetical protein